MKQLNELLKDVNSFNERHSASNWSKLNGNWPEYDVRGLKLVSSIFTGVAFSSEESEGMRLSSSGFKSCKFENCVFRNMVWDSLVFENCAFTDCRFEGVQMKNLQLIKTIFTQGVFKESKIGDHTIDGVHIENSEFIDVLFDRTEFESKTLDFSNCKFLSPIFRNTVHHHGTFYDCEFTAPRFENVKFDNTGFRRGYMDKPVHIPLETSGTILGVTIRILGELQIKPKISKLETFKFSGYHMGSSFDLSDLEGSFGCDGGENVQIHDYSGEGFVALADSKLINSRIWNIRSTEFYFWAKSLAEDVSLDNIEADYVFLDGSTFKNCSFSNIRVRQGLKLEGSRFENCTWKNIKLDPGATMKTEGAVFVGDKPF